MLDDTDLKIIISALKRLPKYFMSTLINILAVLQVQDVIMTYQNLISRLGSLIETLPSAILVEQWTVILCRDVLRQVSIDGERELFFSGQLTDYRYSFIHTSATSCMCA